MTVIGDAGVGKTRLVREIMDQLSEHGARIISGRCLPYGDGITYWPLRGMVLGAASIHQDDTPEQAQEKILACVRDQDVADRLASAAGLNSTTFSMQDINWARQALPADACGRFPGRGVVRRYPLGRAGIPRVDREPPGLHRGRTGPDARDGEARPAGIAPRMERARARASPGTAAPGRRGGRTGHREPARVGRVA